MYNPELCIVINHNFFSQTVRSNGLLREIPFTTLSDYLWLLRACCETLAPLGAHAMLYLAAAVSDFYIPASSMSEHKLQSSEGAPEVKLSLVPKMLTPLVRHWVPKAFVISFKLETDPNLLRAKARKALETYGHRLVIANLLQTRKTEVIAVTKDTDEKLELTQREIAEGVEIEGKIVATVSMRHEEFMKM